MTIHGSLFGGAGRRLLWQTQAVSVTYRAGPTGEEVTLSALVQQASRRYRRDESGRKLEDERELLVQKNAGSEADGYPGLAAATLLGQFQLETDGDWWQVVEVAADGDELLRLLVRRVGGGEVVRDGGRRRIGET